jgi:hypothetical protein
MAIQPPPVPPAPNKGPAPKPPTPQASPPPPPTPNPGPNPSVVPYVNAPPGPDDPGYVEPVDFWQQPFVQSVLPFLTSLVLHISLIIIGLVTFQVVKVVVTPREKEQIIVPDSDIQATEDQPEGGIPHPGLGGDPTRDAAQDKFPDVPKDSKGIADVKGPNMLASLAGGGGGETDIGASVIGIGPGGSSGTGIGTGKGTGLGSGDGDGSGVLAPFGVPGGGGGVGPRSNFLGMGGRAHKVAYVCDASGSMLDMFDSLRVEIRKSVDGLIPTQAFNIIFFQEQSVAAADKASLIMANPESKRRAFEFLDNMVVRGETNPIPALELAFKQQPELIYMLTDGEFPDNQKVIDFCKQKTADGKIKINTIAFIGKEHAAKDPMALEYVKVLQTIAKNSGGNFKFVHDEDLGGK